MESLEGFRFQPSKEQIFRFLEKKSLNPHFSHHSIQDIDDICRFEPWDLAREPITDSEAYFFYELYYKYNKSNSTLKNRTTNAGSWSETGQGSKTKLKSGLTGSKKIFTFYRHGSGSKKSRKTEWVMHEYHVENPSYKKNFVLCHIGRKGENKHGISTPEEGESSQQLIFPTQQVPRDHLISSGNHIDENTVTNNHQQPPPNFNSISHPQNHIQQTTSHQRPPNNTHIPCFENHIEPNTQLPDPVLSTYLRNHIEQNTVSNQQLPPPGHNWIPCFGNHIEQNTITNSQPLPNPNLEKQLPPNQTLVIPNVVENTSPEKYLQHGEFNGCGAYDGLNSAPFSAPQPPNYTLEFSYSSNNINNCEFSNSQIDSEQGHDLFNGCGAYNGLNSAPFSAPQPPNYLLEFSYSSNNINNCEFSNSQIDSAQGHDLFIYPRACQDENSPHETGQTLTPDFNSSKSVGGTSAEVSSDTNTDNYDAWFNELLQNLV